MLAIKLVNRGTAAAITKVNNLVSSQVLQFILQRVIMKMEDRSGKLSTFLISTPSTQTI